MKSLFILTVLTITSIQLHAQGIMAQWPELKSFHSVMGATFHPSEEGNLKPIKERSEELATLAATLASSKIPANFQKPGMQKTLDELKSESAKLHTLITANKADDATITKELAHVHDVFHQIVGLCKDEGKH